MKFLHGDRSQVGERRPEHAAVTRTLIFPRPGDGPASLHREWIRTGCHGRRHGSETVMSTSRSR